MSHLPIFYYPSTLVWVDDDALFIKAALQLLSPSYSVKTFSHPEACLNFFSTYSSPLEKTSFLQGCADHEYYHTVDHSLVNLNVPELNLLNNNPARNEEVSVIILDYNMPGMNGIKLAEKLSHLPAKKILLTGEANYQDAINAFNDNLIDRFVQKDSPNLAIDIKKYVADLTQAYFRDKTQPLLSHLEAEDYLPLSDDKFFHFFQDICRDKRVNEYYILDKNGSFVLIDENKKTSYFIIHSEKSLDSFVHLYDDVIESDELLQLVRERKKIPFFGVGKEPWQFDMKEWEKYFFISNVFEGRERYYWALI